MTESAVNQLWQGRSVKTERSSSGLGFRELQYLLAIVGPTKTY